MFGRRDGSAPTIEMLGTAWAISWLGRCSGASVVVTWRSDKSPHWVWLADLDGRGKTYEHGFSTDVFSAEADARRAVEQRLKEEPSLRQAAPKPDVLICG